MSAHIHRPTLRQAETRTEAYLTTRAETRFERLRAPFSLRCGALLVDYTVVIAILAFTTLIARLVGSGTRWAGTTVLTLGYLVAFAAAILNFIVLASFGGRTFGKWVAGLRIERRDGLPLSLGRSCLRHLAGYALTVLTLGLGFLVAAFNIEGRALHDYVAGTVVVRDRPDAGRGSSSGGGETPTRKRSALP